MTDEALVCPAYEAINLLQEKWVLHIIRMLLEKPRGFNELSRVIGGCNTATLAQRLEQLETLGILKRTVHSVMPPRTSYALTPMGVELEGVVAAIDRWARRHLGKPRGETADPPLGKGTQGTTPPRPGRTRAVRAARSGRM